MPKMPCDRWSESELQQMDEALRIVNGSFVAASKLIDVSPKRFKNAVNAHPWLKARWGKKVRKPKGSSRLAIVPCDDSRERAARSEVGSITGVLALMKEQQRVEIASWLNLHLAAASAATP